MAQALESEMKRGFKLVNQFHANLVCTVCNPLEVPFFKSTGDKMEIDFSVQNCINIIDQNQQLYKRVWFLRYFVKPVYDAFLCMNEVNDEENGEKKEEEKSEKKAESKPE